MRRTLYFRVVFIMFKNLLSRWQDCSLLKVVRVDKGVICHVSDRMRPFFFLICLLLTPVSRASIAAIQQGRVQIVNRLFELGPHRFCPRGVPRTVNYNVVPLSSATGGILLTVHGEVVNPHLAGPQMDHILSVDQSFVLRKRQLDDEDENEGMDG
jgi:hypothetical protein